MRRKGLLLGGAALVVAVGWGTPAAAEFGFEGYPDAPAFELAPREAKPGVPCATCHRAKPPDPTPRQLAFPHPKLDHGGERMWCLSCHSADDRDNLQDFLGRPVAFEDAHLVCGQCHAAKQRDWYFGAHGKRVSGWQGERVLERCAGCHDPHSPAIAPGPPDAPPPVRAGLVRVEPARHPRPAVWEREAEEAR